MAVKYGLLTIGDDKPVPLKEIKVHTTVLGFIANVEYNLTYKNEESNPIEAAFTFPLDEQSAIYRFEAEIEGRLVVGECQGKEEAEQTYQDAIEAGQSAFLLEESDETADVFQCRVGNLPPDTQATIRFAYCIELNIEEDGSVKFVLSSVLGSRYGIGGSASAPADPQGSGIGKGKGKGKKTSHVRPTYVGDGEDVPYAFDFQAEIRGNFVTKVTTGNTADKIKLVHNKKEAVSKVELVSDFKFEHDLILYVLYKNPFSPHVQVEIGNPKASGLLKQDVVMLNFLPQLNKDDVDGEYKDVGEYIIVIDRSGSMTGINMQSAKKALGQFLNALPKDCYFNVISFGSTYSALFAKGSEKLNTVSLTKARNLEKAMSADMGGTEIFRALEFVYKQPAILGYPRQIFLMTDGDVWNSQDIIKLVGKHATTTRMFSFGIGCGASTALVKGVARAGRGKAEFIEENEIHKLPQKVETTLRRAMQPNVNAVTLKWGSDIKAIHIPSELPPIFMGERLIVYAILKGDRKMKENQEIELTGTLKGKKLSHMLKFSLKAAIDEVAPIHRLAAKAKIKELEIDEGYTEKHKKEITIVSKAANIVSRYTSYVGVDKDRPDRISGDMEKRSVPLAPKKKASNLAVPSGSRGAVHYGGACFDAMDAWKYVGGKTAMLPPEFDGWPKVKCDRNSNKRKSTKDGNTELLHGLPNMNTDEVLHDMIEQEKIEAMIQTINLDEMKENNENIKPKKTLKRKAQKKQNFSHKKQRTRPPATSSLIFTQWNEDGYFYAAQVTKQLPNDRFEVVFRDSVKQIVTKNKLIPASYLAPGDEVCFSTMGSMYQQGLVLEYDKEYDEFHVARRDGIIYSLNVAQIMLPKMAASQLLDRGKGSRQAKQVCLYPGNGHQRNVSISTFDLSELRWDGWINENIVNFFLRYIWEECLNDDERCIAEYLSPEFFSYLSRETADGTYSRLANKDLRYERVRPWTRTTDLLGKSFIFVPIFEITHWYVIVIILEKKKSTSNLLDDQFDTIKVRYEVMDSYYADSRRPEIFLLSGFLKKLCTEQGFKLEAAEGAKQLNVPVQLNESDCGLCMLQNIEMYFREDLVPKPNLKWYTWKTLQRKRQFLVSKMMQLRDEQNKHM